MPRRRSAVPFAPGKAGGVKVDLDADLRRLLGELCGQLRELLRTESASSDTAVARLFPPAYPDDPLRNLDFEQVAGDGLMAGRLAGVDAMEGSLDATSLTEEQSLAWLRTLNDLRLVFGTRLEVTEESGPEDFADDPSTTQTFEIYGLLGALESLLLEALDPTLSD